MASVLISGDTSGSITISAPAISGSNTLTLPAVTDTLVGKATTDTLTNKTLTSPTITGATITTTTSTQFKNVIHGLTYDNGTDATNDLNINTGGASDATGVYWMNLATALGKQSDAAWAVGGTTGTPLGGLDTGTVGNSDYYVWLIARSDTGVVDALYSLSSTAPTMPASYDYKRLIGWMKRVGGTIVAMKTYETEGGGIEQIWSVPTLDVDLSNTLTTARRTDAVKVPLNFSTTAHLNVALSDASAPIAVWVYCPDQTDTAPSATAAPLFNWGTAGSVAVAGSQAMRIRTSATGTIAARSTVATIDIYRVATVGFTWARRN